MTNEREPDPIASRRLGAILVVVGLALALGGTALVLLGGSEDATEGRVSVASPVTTTPSTGAGGTSTAPTSTPPTTVPATDTATPTPEPTLAPLTSDDAAAFFDQLTQALTSGDTEFLSSNLHPDVTDRYGIAACEAYLASVPLETSIQVRGIEGPAPWDWVTNDGAVATYDRAWSIDIERLAGSQTLLQVMHLAEVNGRIAWFTDCGDPAGS